MHPDDPDLAEMREKLRLMKGRHVLAAVGELQGAALERAPLGEGAGGLADRDAKARGAGEAGAQPACRRIPARSRTGSRRCARAWTSCRGGLTALTDKQSHYLQDIAIEELGRQKQRIETYQIQARFELAAIYDKTANPSEKPRQRASPATANPPTTRSMPTASRRSMRPCVDAAEPLGGHRSSVPAVRGVRAGGSCGSSSKKPQTIKDLDKSAGRRESRSAARAWTTPRPWRATSASST